MLAAVIISIARAAAWQPAKKFEQPKQHGVYGLNLQSGKARFMGDWCNWSLSPDEK
jgi:hypothetical protein